MTRMRAVGLALLTGVAWFGVSGPANAYYLAPYGYYPHPYYAAPAYYPPYYQPRVLYAPPPAYYPPSDTPSYAVPSVRSYARPRARVRVIRPVRSVRRVVAPTPMLAPVAVLPALPSPFEAAGRSGVVPVAMPGVRPAPLPQAAPPAAALPAVPAPVEPVAPSFGGD